MTAQTDFPTAPLPIPGTVNFRAASPASAGLRPGVLFRADALGAVGDDGRRALVDLGIRRIVDLRSDQETAEAPDDVDGTGIEVVHVPIMGGSVQDSLAQLFGGGGLTLATLYATMLRDGGAAFARVLGLVAEGGPTVIHCTAGKDRTGIAVALSLLAVGVPLDDVVADYARTEANLAGPWVEAMAARIAAYGIPFDGTLQEIVSGSPAEAIRTALDEVVLVDGSADAYLDGIGVDAALRARLRTALLADDEDPGDGA